MRKLIIFIMAIGLYSCTGESIYKYKDSQIVDKSEVAIGKFIKVRSKDGLSISGRIYLYDIDWKKYNIGDTIKLSK